MILFLITTAALAVLALVGLAIVVSREPARTARRKHLRAAFFTINAIDDVVDRYHPQLDLVGQAMAEEIRTLISKHRKEITHR